MKSKLIHVVVILLACAGALLAWTPAGRSAAPADAHQRWEFARLRVGAEACFISDDQAIFSDSGIKLYSKMTGKSWVRRDGDAEGFGVGVDLLNVLGKQGWDVAGADAAGDSYILKRPG